MRKGGEKRTYTDDQRTEALTLIDVYGGNMNRVSRELSIPPATLRQWRILQRTAATAAARGPRETQITDHTALLSRVIVAAAERLLEILPTAESPREVAVALGVTVDKLLDLTQGRRGHTVNVDARSVHLGEVLSDDEQRKVLMLGMRAGGVIDALSSTPAGGVDGETD